MAASTTTIALLLAALAVACLAAPGIGGYGGGLDYYAVPKYAYNYGVNDAYTGDFKTASEHREGGITKGSYSLLQPDGILRTVNYISDPVNGFQAQVINKGVSKHHFG